ncbi:hypothetical protein [Thiohalophilus sp.]|nr:hypothetical protein [Thiohalophilus sp.]MDZ7662335.1 hypothetical protein [Thiohalophilus sp.]MDZ7802418.1 hypothetical protein [Thiohalophilus sp.]
MYYKKLFASTSIKLMMNVAIIGILSGIAIPVYNSSLTESRMTNA